MDIAIPDFFPSRFRAEDAGTPYSDSEAHLRDLMGLLAVHLTLAQIALAENTFMFGDEDDDVGDGNGDSVNESVLRTLPGLALNDREAVEYIDNYPPSPPVDAELLQLLLQAVRQHISERVEATAQRGGSLRFDLLRSRFGLTDFQWFCVLCAYGCETDRGFEQVFVSMHKERTMRSPTLGTALALYRLLVSDFHAETEWDTFSTRLLFVDAENNTPYLLNSLILRREVFSYLGGSKTVSFQMQPYSISLEGDVAVTSLPFREKILEDAAAALLQMSGKTGNLMILRGKRGSGKKRLLSILAQRNSMPLLHVRLDLLWASRSDEELLVPLVLPAILNASPLCLSIGGNEPDDRLLRLMDMLNTFPLNIILLLETAQKGISPHGWNTVHLDFPALTPEQSLCMWKEFAATHPYSADIQWEVLAARQSMTPGQIERALHEAGDVAQAAGVPIGPEELERAIRNGNTGSLSKVADLIPAVFSWEDLVLDDSAMELLREVYGRIQYRHQVENVWGFGAKRPYGNGISVLLYGPPGTGKTMSAQVLANELKLPLYRINLAQIISKYIGETAKNLDAVFAEAKDNSVILFFDEADALFARRTEVNSSNDRHANSESAYLLQKIEDYTGISILASNLVNNFDEAFRRRIMYMISVQMPSQQQRLILWKKAFPTHSLLEYESVLEHLSDKLEISGSSIKAIALQSAYLAAATGGKIRNAHINKAMNWELTKLGRNAMVARLPEND